MHLRTTRERTSVRSKTVVPSLIDLFFVYNLIYAAMTL